MAGLEEMGVSGPSAIADLLGREGHTINNIKEFQNNNAILLPSLKPALNLLDMHGVPRREFHSSVLEEIHKKMLKRVQDLAASGTDDDKKRLQELLDKSFPVVHVSQFRPVVLSVMEHVPGIDKQFLEKILKDHALFEEVSISVKRQIWEDKCNMFAEACSPLISQYVNQKGVALFSTDHSIMSFFVPTPRRGDRARSSTSWSR